MDLRRPRAGELAMAAAGAVLLASLFLPWYGPGAECARAPCPGEETGWEALTAIDVALAAAAALGLAAFVVTAVRRMETVAIVLTSLAALTAGAAVALALLRVVELPGAVDDAVSGGVEKRLAGPWLALAGALGLAAGGLAAMRDERPRGRVEAPVVEVRRLPPTAEGRGGEGGGAGDGGHADGAGRATYNRPR